MDLVIVDSSLAAATLILASPWYVIGLTVLTVLFGCVVAGIRDGDEVWLVLFPIALLVTVASGWEGFLWPFRHPSETFGLIIQYTLIGVLYAIGRWVHLSIREARKIKEDYSSLKAAYQNYVNQFYTDKDYPVVPDSESFEKYLIDRGNISQISNNKMRLARWIVWWPFSMVGFLLCDLIIDLVRIVADVAYKLFGKSFHTIQRWIYSKYGVNDDMLNYKGTPEPKSQTFRSSK